MKKRNRRSGFTLVEAMLTAAVLGISMGVILHIFHFLTTYSVRTRDILARDRMLIALFENIKETAHLYQTDFSENGASLLPKTKKDFKMAYGPRGLTVINDDYVDLEGMGRMDFEIRSLFSAGYPNGLYMIRVRMLENPADFSDNQALTLGDYRDYEFITGLK